MKQDRIYFAFPSKSAEPAKLLVLVININTLQVTFKNQEESTTEKDVAHQGQKW